MAGAVALGFVLLVAPASAADGGLVLDDMSVTARHTDGATTADIHVLNVADATTTLPDGDLSPEPDCTSRITSSPAILPRQRSTVTVLFDAACFPLGQSRNRVIDLDGSGALPAVTVAAPAAAAPWSALIWGATAGLIAAGVVGWWGVRAHRSVVAVWKGQAGARQASYLAVQQLIDARLRLRWKPDLPDGDLKTVHNLEAGWSFKDSWVTNLSVGATALVTLVGSADTLTTLIGDAPQAVLGLMALAGLITAFLIAIANMLVRALGPDASTVTVHGLLASTAVVTGAVAFQVVTVAVAADRLMADAVVARLLSGAAAALVLGLLLVYARRRLKAVLTSGAPDVLPPIPPDALTAWRFASPWEHVIVHDLLIRTYHRWLRPIKVPSGAPVGKALPGGAMPGTAPGSLAPGPTPSITIQMAPSAMTKSLL